MRDSLFFYFKNDIIIFKIMIKKILAFFIFFLSVSFFLYILVLAEERNDLNLPEVKIEGKEVVYQLPYPGILPDHPLYFIKGLRDRILDFLTRDSLKKAELYLLYSDKRINMSQDLLKKGKWSLMISTASKGEKYSLKMVDYLKRAKKQGSSPTSEFILRAKLSNEKHREVLENLLKETPQGERQQLIEVINLNEQIKKLLDNL